MTINYLSDFKKNQSIFESFGELNSIFSNENFNIKLKVYTLTYTKLATDLLLIDDVYYETSIDSADLVILSEPECYLMTESEIIEFKNRYVESIENAKSKGIPILHLVSNPKWFEFFDDLIKEHEISIFITQSLQQVLKLPEERIVNIKEYMSINSLISYTNNINNNILLDLTMAHEKDFQYKLNLNKLIKKVECFSSVQVLISDNSFIPKFHNNNIRVYKESQYDWNQFDNITYVYFHSNKPYDMQNVDKLLFYAANSKVIYSNYNYYINNLLPSVIMNLSKGDYNVEILPEKEALDIMNENRNTVLFNNTSINVLNDLCNLFLGKNLFEYYKANDFLENFTDNMYLKDEKSTRIIDLNLKTFKYDLEKTLTLPIIFLGVNTVKYGRNSATYGKDNITINIPLYTEMKKLNDNIEKELSMIVPIHNNGRYLKFKCFNSILRLSCLDKLEIIFIDDGSSDEETIRIIEDLLLDYPAIVYKRFESGSGSASRPRNIGMKTATCEYITFLDPDNEAIENGYTILLNELKANEKLDMVVADIVREDNFKRNDISYYKKVMKVRTTPFIKNMKKLLLDTNLSVQSIQALIVKKEIIDNNNLTMIEGAAGQDTLFFQELLLSCNYIKVLNYNVHSYYAFVEGSVTNTVTHKFFEKFYRVEIERKKFLVNEDLIEFYMDRRFNSYMKNWYYKKLMQINDPRELMLAKNTILKIFNLYKDYSNFYDNDTEIFRKKLTKEHVLEE